MKFISFLFSILILFCFVILGFGQVSLERFSIGSSVIGSNISSIYTDYSGGQSIVFDLNGQNIILSQGFQQATTSGVSTHDLDTDFLGLVYPNPTMGIIKVDFPWKSAEATIVNQFGMVVRTFSLTQHSIYNIGDLPSGNYYINILSENKTHHLSYKIVLIKN